MPIRVAIADDHELVRSGLRFLIEDDPEISVVAEAENGRQAVEFAESLQPDVLLMDVNMPVMSGIQATQLIASSCPQVRVIGLSMHDDPAIAQAIRDAGAVAFVTKYISMDGLLETIRAAVA